MIISEKNEFDLCLIDLGEVIATLHELERSISPDRSDSLRQCINDSLQRLERSREYLQQGIHRVNAASSAACDHFANLANAMDELGAMNKDLANRLFTLSGHLRVETRIIY